METWLKYRFAIVFGLFTLLMFDFWNWQDEVVLGWLGLPLWIYRAMLLQLAFAGAMWWFIKNKWSKEGEDE